MSHKKNTGQDIFLARKMSKEEGKYSIVSLRLFYRGQDLIFYVSVAIALWGCARGVSNLYFNPRVTVDCSESIVKMCFQNSGVIALIVSLLLFVGLSSLHSLINKEPSEFLKTVRSIAERYNE